MKTDKEMELLLTVDWAGIEKKRKSDLQKFGYVPKEKFSKKPFEKYYWKVNKKGSMSFGNYYHIEYTRLQEDWINHMRKKNWVDLNEFIPAYVQACRNAGIKSINLLDY